MKNQINIRSVSKNVNILKNTGDLEIAVRRFEFAKHSCGVLIKKNSKSIRNLFDLIYQARYT